MANGTAHAYHSAAPLKARRMPSLVYVGLTVLIWAPVMFVVSRWLYP